MTSSASAKELTRAPSALGITSIPVSTRLSCQGWPSTSAYSPPRSRKNHAITAAAYKMKPSLSDGYLFWIAYIIGKVAGHWRSVSPTERFTPPKASHTRVWSLRGSLSPSQR